MPDVTSPCGVTAGHHEMVAINSAIEVDLTEHGIAPLHGRPVRERAQALVDVAAPEHREFLGQEAHRLYGFSLRA